MKNVFHAVTVLCIMWYVSPLYAQFSNTPSASSVLGQTDFVSSSAGTTAGKFINGAFGVAIDSVTGKVFVSDRYNNRVLRFSAANAHANGGSAEAVFGQTDFVTGSAASVPTASSLNNPIGVFMDKVGRLWVADFGNNRVLRYDSAATKSSGAAADAVFGQPGFTTKTSGTTASSLNQPVGIFFDDRTNNFWVSDFGNHRVLKFANAPSKANGSNADVVLGQASFTTKTTGLSASAMNNPNGVYIDVEGNLWVSDRVNCRFLKFANADAKTNGASADGVLGQPDFVTNTSSPVSISRSGYARFVWGDKNGRLYCMQESQRITVYEHASAKVNGADADGIIGQADFSSTAAPNPPTASSLRDPKAMFVNNANGDLWVAEQTNNRVLRYELNPAIAIPLTLTAPNGGEQWANGSIETITWKGNITGTVTLEYSSDLGATWKFIDTAATAYGNSAYAWTVPSVTSSKMLVRISDRSNIAAADTSNGSFLISDKVIVVVGSSTAAGQGPSSIDSAWVWRYRRYVKSLYPTAIVVNLAVGGYSTYECMPTGFVPPAGKAAPHTNANITKALSYHPRAIIVNLPTNDAYWNYTLTETMNNFNVIAAEAASRNIPMWISTSQGRNLSQTGRDVLLATRDSILSVYKDRAIDFWTGLCGADGYILASFNSGDGVHMNSDAHKILCDRVIGAKIAEKAFTIVSPSVSIAEARKDANNDLIADHSVTKDTLVIFGVVTGPNFSTTGTSYFIQDATGGIDVFSYDPYPTKLDIGDSIMVAGTVAQFRGLVEITPGGMDAAHITTIKKNAAVPAPKRISVQQFLSDPESFEGQLVEIDTLYKTSGVWPATGENKSVYVADVNKKDSVQMFLDVDTDIDGTAEPQWPVNAVGIITQYASSSTAYHNGYELMPRGKSDIKPITVTAVNVMETGLPKACELADNFPNPFNPSTVIRFALPGRSHAKLTVYDMLGREVRALVNGMVNAGFFETTWNGRNDAGRQVSSGMYVYRMEAGSFVASKKMMLLK